MLVAEVLDKITTIKKVEHILCDLINEDMNAELHSERTGDSIYLTDLCGLLMEYEDMLKKLPIKEVK